MVAELAGNPQVKRMKDRQSIRTSLMQSARSSFAYGLVNLIIQ
jgi:hypothetical protein